MTITHIVIKSMFRTHAHIERMPVYGGFAPVVYENVPQEDGTNKRVATPSNQMLPDGKNYKLENLIKAKVPLEQTKTKILVGESLALAPSDVKLSLDKDDEEIDKQFNENNE